jgi:hypothetical protein
LWRSSRCPIPTCAACPGQETIRACPAAIPRDGEPAEADGEAARRQTTRLRRLRPPHTSPQRRFAAAQEALRPGAGTPYQAATRAGTINRKPVRYLKDPYAAFSAIAVNPDNDMVMVTDENLFRVVEYSRTANTPVSAQFTEPRRVIGGPGHQGRDDVRRVHRPQDARGVRHQQRHPELAAGLLARRQGQRKTRTACS